MDCNCVKTGLRIRTSKVLGQTTGMLISQKILGNRSPNTPGTVYSYVPGHGGDVWYVVHDPKEGDTNTFLDEAGELTYKSEYMAAYCFDELESI